MFYQPAVKIRSNFLSISVHAYLCWKLKVEALRTSVLMYVGYWLRVNVGAWISSKLYAFNLRAAL